MINEPAEGLQLVTSHTGGPLRLSGDADQRVPLSPLRSEEERNSNSLLFSFSNTEDASFLVCISEGSS